MLDRDTVGVMTYCVVEMRSTRRMNREERGHTSDDHEMTVCGIIND